jgi:hypothetical protein
MENQPKYIIVYVINIMNWKIKTKWCYSSKNLDPLSIQYGKHMIIKFNKHQPWQYN